jgi:hypothetical protein
VRRVFVLFAQRFQQGANPHTKENLLQLRRNILLGEAEIAAV